MYSKNKTIKRILSLSIIMAIIVGMFGGIRVVNAYVEKKGYVNENNVNVRTGPGTSYANVTSSSLRVQLSTNHQVTIIGEKQGDNPVDSYLWYQIRFVHTDGKTLTGYIRSDLITLEVEYTPDVDFEKYLTDQGFPESYKEGLRSLHTKYPNWVFVADHLDYTLDQSATGQTASLTRSLVPMSSLSSWKSLNYGAYDWKTSTWTPFDNGSWTSASTDIVRYYLDPRNFLNEKQIFQFEQLSYNAARHTLDKVEATLLDSFMDKVKIENNKTYAQVFMDAATTAKVNPIFLAARVLMEQGKGTSPMISGTYPGYIGIYNFFNFGATGNTNEQVIINGLKYASANHLASDRPWNTRTKAIIGGAKLIENGYISIGQDTLYYQKFDFVGSPYTHQYMQNIAAPSVESIKMYNGYPETYKTNTAITFKIPVFKNMPANVTQRPTKNGSPNNALKSLIVNSQTLIDEKTAVPNETGFTHSYDMAVDNAVSSVNVTAITYDSKAKITGNTNHSLKVGSNTITIRVTAENGDIRDYKVNVIRRQASTTPDTETPTTQAPAPTTPAPTTPDTEPTTQAPAPTTPAPTTPDTEPPTQAPTQPVLINPTLSSSTYNIKSNKYITNIGVKKDITEVIKKININIGSFAIVDKNYKSKKGYVATNDKLIVKDSKGKTVDEYTFIIYGDLNLDGLIDIKDILFIQRHILGYIKLEGNVALAADTNRGADGIDLRDFLSLARQILGHANISQK